MFGPAMQILGHGRTETDTIEGNIICARTWSIKLVLESMIFVESGMGVVLEDDGARLHL